MSIQKLFTEKKTNLLLTFLFYILQLFILGFPDGSDCEESACNAGGLGSIPGSRRYPWEIPWTEEPGGPWGLKESDMTD